MLWNILGKVIGLVPAIVKIVRETSRRGKGTGHYYTATDWYPDGRVATRSPTCFHCGRLDLDRVVHTEPACNGRREP